MAGTFLFRWRSYFPLGALVLVVSQMRHVAHGGARYPDSLPWGALCLVVALAGLGVRAYVAGHVPQGTSGRNTRSQICEGLNTDGAYSMVRHPLYLGNFLIWLGVALVPRSGVAIASGYGRVLDLLRADHVCGGGVSSEQVRRALPLLGTNHTRVPAQPSALPSTLVAILASDRSSKGVLELVRGHRVVCVARDDGEFECSWSPRGSARAGRRW